MPAFSATHRVVRYDVRNFGRSSIAKKDFAHHEDLNALLRHLAIEQATVLGVSMGGTLTIDFALAYPQDGKRAGVGRHGTERLRPLGRRDQAGLGRRRSGPGGRDMERAIEINLGMWVGGPFREPDAVDPRCAPASTRCSLTTCREKAKARLGTSSPSRPAS
jgi:3-oxoadipate enol-lactonase